MKTVKPHSLETVKPKPLVVEQPKEKVEATPITNEVNPAHIERKLEEFGVSREFVKKYGLGLALLYCQPKVDVKKLAEYYGSKLRRHYSFPELENNYANRLGFTQAVESEGGVYIDLAKDEESRSYRYSPSVRYSNTSKELAEKISLWMCRPLSKPRMPPHPSHLPKYNVVRCTIPAIDLVYLIRPLLIKKENIEKADKIIKIFKERPSIRYDENGNLITRPEPKYIQAHKLRQKGLTCEEIAQRLGCKLRRVYELIYYANSPELHRKWKHDYRRRKKGE